MGYKVGKTISDTISRIKVPKLLEDDETNPFVSEPEYKRMKEL